MKIKKFNENFGTDDEKLSDFGFWIEKDILNFDKLEDYIDFLYMDIQDKNIEYLFYFKETTLEIISSLYNKISESRYIDNVGKLKVTKHDDYPDIEQYAISIMFDMDSIDNHFNNVLNHSSK